MDLNILNINANYPGSVHDSAIWTMSKLSSAMEKSYREGDKTSMLIGKALRLSTPPIIQHNTWALG